jgi:hypothetical protein
MPDLPRRVCTPCAFQELNFSPAGGRGGGGGGGGGGGSGSGSGGGLSGSGAGGDRPTQGAPGPQGQPCRDSPEPDDTLHGMEAWFERAVRGERACKVSLMSLVAVYTALGLGDGLLSLRIPLAVGTGLEGEGEPEDGL